MRALKTVAIIVLNFTFFLLSAQDKSYKSSKNIVIIANGIPASVTNEKKMYFEIWLDKVCNGNDCGRINIADGPMHSGQTIVSEGFRIYSVKLSENGIYNYWTIDIGSDGQSILFQVDNNSAVPSISMHRYSPGAESKILKSTVYYID